MANKPKKAQSLPKRYKKAKAAHRKSKPGVFLGYWKRIIKG